MKIYDQYGNVLVDYGDIDASQVVSGRFPVDRLPAMADEKIWKGTGGNVEEVDMPAAGATLTVIAGAGTEVFTGTPPTTWTDLDLSGTVGSQATLVLLKVKQISSSTTRAVAFRQNGDTEEFYILPYATAGIGVALASIANTAYIVLLVTTDTSGVIEWKHQSGAGYDTTIDVIAYIK